MMFGTEKEKFDSEELAKDSNLPAVKWAMGILSQSEAGDQILGALDNIIVDESKRKRSPKINQYAQSQDPSDLLRNIRKKRSQGLLAVGDVSLDGNESPKTWSMSIFQPKESYKDVPMNFKNLNWNSQTDNGTQNDNILSPIRTSRKKDVSNVSKYSPFERKSMSTNKKRRGYSKNKVGSNSFLSNTWQQKGRLAVHKGGRKQRKTELTGALSLISKKSCAMKQAQDDLKSGIVELPSQEQTQSVAPEFSQKSECSILTKKDMNLQEMERSKDQIMEDSEPEKNVYVVNTPTKADLKAMEKSDEFEF